MSPTDALRLALDALEDARHHMSAAGAFTEPQLAAQDAIRSALAAAPAPGWQPIGTAPQDGTEFLGYRRGNMATAYRVPREDCEMWVFGNESGAYERWPEVRPTHWMPKPPAPGV